MAQHRSAPPAWRPYARSLLDEVIKETKITTTVVDHEQPSAMPVTVVNQRRGIWLIPLWMIVLASPFILAGKLIQVFALGLFYIARGIKRGVVRFYTSERVPLWAKLTVGIAAALFFAACVSGSHT